MGSQRSDALEAVCRCPLQAVVSHGHGYRPPGLIAPGIS